MNEPTFKMFYTNWKGETRVREVIPCKVEFQEYNQYHQDNVWIMKAVCVEDQSKFKEFNMEDIIRGTVISTLRAIGDPATESKVDGVMNLLKGEKDVSK